MVNSDLSKIFLRLVDVMAELREKCPWDKKQDFSSLRHLTIEETFELSEAILNENPEEIKAELGDVLLHIVFYARLAEEKKWFTMHDVIQHLIAKLIRRHPHIYGDEIANDEDAVKQNWERIKLAEKNPNNKVGLLQGVPKALPSIVKAYRMQEKAAQVGFDWNNKEDVWAKVKEELLEFEQAKTSNERKEEFGDLMFSLINFARFEKINPDDALESTNKKFKKRFEFIETQAAKENKALKNLSLAEMDIWWNAAKNES